MLIHFYSSVESTLFDARLLTENQGSARINVAMSFTGLGHSLVLVMKIRPIGQKFHADGIIRLSLAVADGAGSLILGPRTAKAEPISFTGAACLKGAILSATLFRT